MTLVGGSKISWKEQGYIVGDDGPSILTWGIIFLLLAAILTCWLILKPKIEARRKREEKLESQKGSERKQKWLASLFGLEKYQELDLIEANDYQDGLKAMRELGHIIEHSVYQEKEKDWALLGGIADGIAGPAAGIATAAQAMQDNQRIKAENAKRIEQAAQQSLYFKQLASELEAKRPYPLSTSEVENIYSVNYSWSPLTLFSRLTITNPQVKIDSETGAVNVTAEWYQKGEPLCIDGAIRAKLYSSDNRCAGCAYLVFPKSGSTAKNKKLEGICATPNSSDSYRVTFEPIDLWELTLKSKEAAQGDNLSLEEHRKIVNELKEKYRLERENQ